MKREMARPGAGRQGTRGRVVGDQRTVGRIEFIDHDLVKAKVTSEGEPIGGVGRNKMPVRPSLALLVHTGTAVLDKGGWRVQTSIRLDGQSLDAASPVVRHQNRLAGFIDRNVARAVAAGRLLVQRCEFT